MCEIMKVYFHPSDSNSLITRDESEEIDTSSITGIIDAQLTHKETCG